MYVYIYIYICKVVYITLYICLYKPKCFQLLECVSVCDHDLYVKGMLSSWTWLALKENGK